MTANYGNKKLNGDAFVSFDLGRKQEKKGIAFDVSFKNLKLWVQEEK